MSAKEHLLCKILEGDSSDNIPNVFTRCGPKTAGKLIRDKEALKEKLQADRSATDQLKLNTRLIDFTKVPKRTQKLIVDYVTEQIS